MKYYTIIDSETDGLLDEVTKIHVISYNILDENGKSISKGSITDPAKMVSFLSAQEIIVGHNIIRFDIPVFKKVLGIKYKGKAYDTLGISWYLFPTEVNDKGKVVPRKRHGLEAWGIQLGFPKPPIEDWRNLSIERYIERCEGDVEINTRFWSLCKSYLEEIYGDAGINRILGYIGFKLDCAREQEEVYCKIAKVRCHQYLDNILTQIEERTSELASHMPDNEKFKKVKRPKNLYKQDGELSSYGEKWFERCKELNVDPLQEEEIKVYSHSEPGNPNSTDQLKDWLFSLGWEPTIYKESTSKVTGITKEVPQITNEKGKICKSIKSLYKTHPYLEHLEGLSILNHRKGVFEGFLKELDDNDRVQAKIDGFTNTLRMQHRKPIANLTKVGKPWGKEIRSLIIAPDENYVLCGSDMSALEDTTKQHYMYFYDPEYVNVMRIKGFDPHTDIAVFAQLMTKEEEQTFKDLKQKDEDINQTLSEEEYEIYHHLSSVRGNAKTVNFAGVYGAGPAKIAKTLGCDIEFAKKLHTAYWERNKAVKLVAKNTYHKTVRGQMWLYNPVSGFWYSLRYEKDKFSTLNQGTGKVLTFNKLYAPLYSNI